MRAPKVRTPRKVAPPAALVPALISLSDVAAIRWRGHGKDEPVALTAEQLASVLRIAEHLWYDGAAIGWQRLGLDGIATDAENLRGTLDELIMNGEPASVDVLAVLEVLAATIQARAIYGDGGRPDDFTLVLGEKGATA